MSDKAKLRVVLVGAGVMGKNHARAVLQSDRTDLVCIVEQNRDIGTAAAERFGASWAPELPSLRGIDAVIIAAATEAHYSLAQPVIENRVPLLLEKPVSNDLEQTENLIRSADALDLPFMCGLLERFNPAVLTAKRLLEAPHHITATRHSPYAPRIRTGVAWDLLIHDVDLAIGFMGHAPVRVDAHRGFFHQDSAGDSEDVVESILQFDGGSIAQISASRIGQRKIRELKIYDANKLVEVDLLRRDVTIYRHVSENSVDEGRGYRQQTVIEIPELITSQEPLAAQLNYFVDLVNGTGDAAAERRSLLPAHRVIAQIVSQNSGRP